MFKQQTARLFPAVASLAVGGDAACVAILDSARQHLLQHIEAVLAKMDEAERAAVDRLVCAGGVFANNEGFYMAFGEQFQAAFPSLEAIRLLEPASLGALALGEEAGSPA
jgi:N-acetylglucosamine kinase-like BadF-type ATPase